MSIRNTLYIIATFLLIYFVTNANIFYRRASIIWANIMQDTSLYVGKNTNLMQYNSALWLAKSQQYHAAKLQLQTLLDQWDFSHQWAVWELYADTLYMTSGSLDDTKQAYLQSLKIQHEPRILKKIALLSKKSKSKPSQDESVHTGSTDEMQTKKQELKVLSTMRKEWLQSDMQGNIQSTLDQIIQSQKTGKIHNIQDW